MKHKHYIPQEKDYFMAFIKHGKLKGRKHKFSPFRCIKIYNSKGIAWTVNAVSCDIEWVLSSWEWDFK